MGRGSRLEAAKGSRTVACRFRRVQQTELLAAELRVVLFRFISVFWLTSEADEPNIDELNKKVNMFIVSSTADTTGNCKINHHRPNRASGYTQFKLYLEMDFSTVLRKKMVSSTFLNFVQSDRLRLTANQNANFPSTSILYNELFKQRCSRKHSLSPYTFRVWSLLIGDQSPNFFDAHIVSLVDSDSCKDLLGSTKSHKAMRRDLVARICQA